MKEKLFLSFALALCLLVLPSASASGNSGEASESSAEMSEAQDAVSRGIPEDWLVGPSPGLPEALYPRPALGDPVFQAEIDSLCVQRSAKTVELPLKELLASQTRIKKGKHLPRKHVILSFDDGPHNPFTLLILDMLDRCKVKAHFFVVGKLVSRPEHRATLERLLDQGHVLGSHSHSHANLLDIELGAARREIERGHRALEKTLGIRTSLFRFPFGAGSSSHALREILADNGLVSMGWTMSAYDTVYDQPASVLEHSLIRFEEESRGGMIFLAHDRKRATVRMLPDLLKFLVERDYTFVVVKSAKSPNLRAEQGAKP